MSPFRTALVTGASRGIGSSTARKLAGAGYSVCINYTGNESGARQTLNSLQDQASGSFVWKADVSSPGEVRAMFDEIGSRWGRLDVLVNNAGIYERSAFDGIDFESWRRTLSVNLDGMFLCTSLAAPMMKSHGYGRIVNISSQLAFKGSRHGAHYAASKSAMIGFTRSLALELGRHGITVNMVAPGAIRTRILEGYSDEDLLRMSGEIPSGRIGEPGDVADAVLFLCSEGASYINGSTIGVSGGSLLH